MKQLSSKSLGFLAILLCLLLALPVLGVFGAWFAFDSAAWAVLVHQAQTVLPGFKQVRPAVFDGGYAFPGYTVEKGEGILQLLKGKGM